MRLHWLQLRKLAFNKYDTDLIAFCCDRVFWWFNATDFLWTARRCDAHSSVSARELSRCAGFFCTEPNETTHTSSEETVVTERVPAEPSSLPPQMWGSLYTHTHGHIPPICKSLMAAVNTFTCLWQHSQIVLQNNKSINRSGRCLASPRRHF